MPDKKGTYIVNYTDVICHNCNSRKNIKTIKY